MTTTPASTPFDFQLPGGGPLGRLVQPVVAALGEWLLALPEVKRTYRRALEQPGEDGFIDKALASLNIVYQLDRRDIARIPAVGPLIVVANHPFGGVDGLILSALLRRVRPDVKLLANALLSRIPQLHEGFLFVDPFATRGAVRRNVPAMRAALAWVRGGGALGVFPAGEVSHLDLRGQRIEDGPWDPSIGRLAARTGASVLPVCFDGRNSWLFQAAGLLHPLLRTLLLPRELLKQRNQRIAVHVGKVITPDRLAKFSTDAKRADYLRVRTHILGARAATRSSTTTAAPAQAINPPEPVDTLEDELSRLPPQQRLANSGDFTVFYGRAGQLPTVLRELGRLREIAFRQVGEGTGSSCDLDRFDRHYLHLLVWNRAQRQIVGAYRLGLTDEILPRFGIDGLYTSTLFRYGEGLLREIAPAIELGRSFVRMEYQRQFAPLLLLWKGIGLFVARHPRYQRLFGPVSISNDYASLSKQLLVAFLRINSSLPRLGRLIRPRHPLPFGPRRRDQATLAATAAESIDDLDALVAEIESHARGVPVLLRQYLKLGARLLGFNVDPSFGHALDGLMLIDLLDVEPNVLARYMGRENAQAFRAHHTPRNSTSPSARSTSPGTILQSLGTRSRVNRTGRGRGRE